MLVAVMKQGCPRYKGMVKGGPGRASLIMQIKLGHPLPVAEHEEVVAQKGKTTRLVISHPGGKFSLAWEVFN